jgi:predicted RNase H-like HicB family nuclease
LPSNGGLWHSSSGHIAEHMVKSGRVLDTLYWSDEDQAVIAQVPEPPGCAADGLTYEEALANAQSIIDEWLETARQLGREIPKPIGRLMLA